MNSSKYFTGLHSLAEKIIVQPVLTVEPGLKRQLRDMLGKTISIRTATVVPTKSDSDVIFCLQLLSKHLLVHSTSDDANR